MMEHMKDPQQPVLHKLAKSNSLDSVRSLIQEGKCDLQAKNRSGSTALHVAAYYGHLSVFDELIGTGQMDAEQPNDSRWSSVHYLNRFHQPLNQKLDIAIKMQPPRHNSSRFQFRYFKRSKTGCPNPAAK